MYPMKEKILVKHRNVHRLYRLLPLFISFSLALLAGAWLLSKTVIDPLVSAIINVGLDPLRSQFIAALIMTMLAALFGAMLGRNRLSALIGASAAFCLNYLLGFIQLELRPVYDPGGHLEPLDMTALVHTSFVMLALALLSSFLGSATGVAAGEVLLDPPWRLARLLWQRFRRNTLTLSLANDGLATSPSLWQTVTSWLGVAGLSTLLVVGATGASPLFIFSPDVGLHVSPSVQKAHGTIVPGSLVSPALNGQTRSFLIYLPPSYNTPAGKTKHYPTLYLLHGTPGKDSDWMTGGRVAESADTLIDTGKTAELIMVIPDGNGRPGQTSEWANSFDQHQRLETFVASDLVTYIDQHYRTIPDAAHRGIGGLSMGGFGATNIAVHHPTIFGTVISLGGYYQAEGAIWGHNAAYMQQNSPLNVLPHDRSAWKLHMYIGAATKDQPYYKYAQQFIQELHTLHIPYQFDLQNGYHSWRVWQVQMYNALGWVKWG
jgi:enterochelin esterase-like enzyme